MREIKGRQECFICQCKMIDHQFCITLLDDDDPRFVDLSFEPMLNTYLPLHKRIMVAIRYILGYRSRYGLFDSMLISEEDIPRIESIINEYKEKKCLKG